MFHYSLVSQNEEKIMFTEKIQYVQRETNSTPLCEIQLIRFQKKQYLLSPLLPRLWDYKNQTSFP